MDKVYSASIKSGPSLPYFCHPDVIITWQQSAPESEKLKWVNNGYKLNSQGYGKLRQLFGSSHLPENSIFGVCIPSPTLGHLRKAILVGRGLRLPFFGLFEHLQLDCTELPLIMSYQNVVILRCFPFGEYFPQSSVIKAPISLDKFYKP